LTRHECLIYGWASRNDIALRTGTGAGAGRVMGRTAVRCARAGPRTAPCSGPDVVASIRPPPSTKWTAERLPRTRGPFAFRGAVSPAYAVSRRDELVDERARPPSHEGEYDASRFGVRVLALQQQLDVHLHLPADRVATARHLHLPVESELAAVEARPELQPGDLAEATR